MTNKLKVSVITPNYNYAKYIGQTIQSVIDQDYDNWEHIIVDDGSTDDSVSVITKYKDKYPQNIILVQQANHGQTAALNVALSKITGDIICWINSDDYFFTKDIFSTIIKHFDDTNPDAVFGDIAIIDKGNKVIRYKKYFNFSYSAGVFIGFGRIISSNAIFWKTDIMGGVRFDEMYTYSMDADFFSRLLYNRRVIHINKVVSVFRWHEKAKTNKVKTDKRLALEASNQKERTTIKAYKNLLVSNIIPYTLFPVLRFSFRCYRTLLKFIYGWKNYR